MHIFFMKTIYVISLKLIHMFMFATNFVIAFMMSFMSSFKLFFNDVSLLLEVDVTDFAMSFMMSFRSSFENKNFDSCASCRIEVMSSFTFEFNKKYILSNECVEQFFCIC